MELHALGAEITCLMSMMRFQKLLVRLEVMAGAAPYNYRRHHRLPSLLQISPRQPLRSLSQVIFAAVATAAKITEFAVIVKFVLATPSISPLIAA